MKTNKIFSLTGLVVFTVLLTLQGYAQKQSLDIQKYMKKGDLLYNDPSPSVMKYRDALEAYMKEYQAYKDFAILNLRIADCHYKLAEDDLAEKYGELAFTLDSNIAPSVNFFKGHALQMQNKFRGALKYFKKYSTTPGLTEKEKASIAFKIKECETAIKMEKDVLSCFIENLGPQVNTVYNDYKPVYYSPKVLYYTSRKIGKKMEYDDEGSYAEQSFIANVLERTPYTSVKDKSTLYKKFDMIQSFSKDGGFAIVYTANNSGDIGEAQLKNGKISKVKMFPKYINTKNGQEGSGTYGFTKDTVYFTSDAHKGYGGLDIFFLTRNQKGKWSKPVNLGPTINTPQDEYSPFLSQDGSTLYFSSAGHDGIGGFDIFKSERKNGVFQTPQNLGMPINTPYSDVHYMEIPNTGVAYYATCQRTQNMGGLDIYKITYVTPKDYILKPELAGLSLIGEPLKQQQLKETEMNDKSTLVRGLVFDADTEEPLSARLVLFDLATLDSLAAFMSDENTGAFRISLPPGKNYAINAIKEGYLFFSLNFNVPETADKQVIDQEIPLQKVQKNKAIVLKNIFFDTGKSTLRPESDLEIGKLEQILRENPTMVVEVSGHTDNVGGAEYNKKLSADRAKAVVTSLVSKGIDAKRMVSAGYGMDRPIADNKTEEGRQLNRRTEFKIIEL